MRRGKRWTVLSIGNSIGNRGAGPSVCGMYGRESLSQRLIFLSLIFSVGDRSLLWYTCMAHCWNAVRMWSCSPLGHGSSVLGPFSGLYLYVSRLQNFFWQMSPMLVSLLIYFSRNFS